MKNQKMKSKNLKTIIGMPLIVIIAMLSVSAAHAGNVVYVLSNVNNPDQNMVDIIEDMGYTVDKVDNQDIDTVTWSNYNFMLVGNNVFSNEEDIPVNDFPALIVNTKYMDDWHWTTKMSQKSSSQPIRGYVNDPEHIITEGFPLNVQVYDSSTPTIYYLHRYYKSIDLDTILSTDDTYLESFNAIIATAIPGTALKDGYYSNSKGVFFGITDSAYWTSYSEQLFRNSVTWLDTDFFSPKISNISNTSITNSSAVIKWDTNTETNSTVFYPDINKTNATLTIHHEILLEDLDEGTTYSYSVKSCNEDGYCNQSGEYFFTTLDYTAPFLISQSVENKTNSSANISLEINEESYSRIFYGTTPTNMDQVTPTSQLGAAAYFNIINLDELTEYHYLFEMCDNSDNCRNSSVYTFTTLDITTPMAPQNLRLDVLNDNNNIMIRWDEATDDAVNYNIYISDLPDNFSFENPDSTTSLDEYLDTEASSVNQRYYIVRAEDSSGNEENNSYVIGKFDLELKDGYNLVSLPLVPFNNNINFVMHQDVSYHPVSEIRRYNSTKQEFEITTCLGILWDLFSFQELNPGTGYFFNSSMDTNFTIVGTLPEPLELEISKGMNMIGLASLNEKNISDVIPQTVEDNNVTELGKRNINQIYDLATYYSNDLYNEFTLKPGKGYWLKAMENFTLELN